jgi:hypothetical protein
MPVQWFPDLGRRLSAVKVACLKKRRSDQETADILEEALLRSRLKSDDIIC